MSLESTPTPSPRRLLLIGTTALALAGAVAAYGIIERAHSEQHVAQWTDKQVIPTVALATLAPDAATRDLTLPGTIQAYNKALIYARVSGYLNSWQVDIGAHVTTGQRLASIDSPDLDQQLEQAKADLASAEANERLAALTAERWRALLTRNAVAQQAVDDKAGDAAAKKAMVAAAQANVRRLEAMVSFKNIVAPFDGVVTARNTDIGALITAGSVGQELFEVSDLHQVRIYIQVPQAFSFELRPGLTATLEMPQYPGQQFDATVVTTSNVMDVSSRSMLVELQADNAEGKLFAGAYCQVHVQLPGDPTLVRVPATALVPVDHGVQVAVLGKDDKVMLTAIQLGRDFGDSVEVVAGLSPSDRVIDRPSETLQSGDEVQLATPTPSAKAVATAATGERS
ncbi:MAG TPA: efflux RND transporter periplasmic adaptor subunit [Bradyrhizobium sp.]|jgi:RND family efflux transporter MFP subunit|nr:efflux RND transporter periplasmic adaptor subunit [Bradyrhizobium sp.]